MFSYLQKHANIRLLLELVVSIGLFLILFVFWTVFKTCALKKTRCALLFENTRLVEYLDALCSVTIQILDILNLETFKYPTNQPQVFGWSGTQMVSLLADVVLPADVQMFFTKSGQNSIYF